MSNKPYRYTGIDPVREQKYEHMLREIIRENCSGRGCRVFLFGSRAAQNPEGLKERVKRTSDFDIGIEGLSEREFYMLRSRIQEQAEQAHIPHDVDIVNFATADTRFKELAKKGMDIWVTD